MTVNEEALDILSPAAREAFLQAQKSAQDGDDYALRAFAALKHYPVSIETFIQDPAYVGSDALYPEVMKALVDLNNPAVEDQEHRSRLWNQYTEAVLTGGIGTGKSTIAVYSMLYQLYVLSCFRSPHEYFELDPTSEIVIIFQNRTERLAKAVDYDRFKALVEQSPYFKENFPFDHKLKSELRFPNRIIVKPVSGSDTAAIGQNVISGIIDEVNFMETVERSRKSYDGRTYDQASSLYETIARRRASRFQKRGNLPGLLCVVSSRRYPGQFTDQREDERTRQIQETGSTSIYLYDRKLWEIKPEGTYSGETFRVFIGNFSQKPRVLAANENDDGDLSEGILDIPIEHKPEFDRDILNALRDIAGVSTQAIQPFFTNREAIAACFNERPSIISSPSTDFTTQSLTITPTNFYRPELIRFVHLDLSISGDATGVVVGCVDKFVQVQRGQEIEVLPHIHIDIVLQVFPPSDGEIPYHRIRELLYALRDNGLNIEFISADSFQSVDMLQILQRAGFKTGQRSMDRTLAPYEILKSALYDNRVSIPEHHALRHELIALEVDHQSKKVDHPPAGSKDVSDALAGVVHGLTMRREIWTQHKVRPENSAPRFVQRVQSSK
jgi:hypothetical protein